MRRTVRASDADRESVVERLQQAFGEGRITVSEFDERARAATMIVPFTLAGTDGVPATGCLP